MMLRPPRFAASITTGVALLGFVDLPLITRQSAAFDHRGNREAVALKGMLWARWASLVIINVHMTFCYEDDGSQVRT